MSTTRHLDANGPIEPVPPTGRFQLKYAGVFFLIAHIFRSGLVITLSLSLLLDDPVTMAVLTVMMQGTRRKGFEMRCISSLGPRVIFFFFIFSYLTIYYYLQWLCGHHHTIFLSPPSIPTPDKRRPSLRPNRWVFFHFSFFIDYYCLWVPLACAAAVAVAPRGGMRRKTHPAAHGTSF